MTTGPPDLLLGRLALERGLLSPDQLAACMSDQAAAPAESLGAIMLRKGLIRQRELDGLLDEQKQRLAGALEMTDPKLEDALLGRLLVKQGLLKEAQLYDCLRASAEAAEAGAAAPRLADLLVRRGLLASPSALRPAAPKRETLVCPNCRSTFTATDGKKHPCRQCGATLERQAPSSLGETTEALKVDMPEDVQAVARKPERLFAGKYILVEEVGHGGMGVVWRAWQKDLRRYVAIKILVGTLWTDVEIKRFYREAQMAASLSHPNIASIYEVGTHDGKHFIAMEFVEGDSLAKLMTPSVRQNTTRAVKHLPPRRAIEILREVSLAVEVAHAKGIIHRDLKPHNIMVSKSEGRVYVMDFGLAKPVKSGDSITVSDAIVGTPQYMSPEQARGDAVDRRTDVYSLGAVLYHILTGRPPFEGRSPAEIMLSVLADDPPPMRKLNPRIHADVETIVLKALDKDRHRRYDSARSLADDLGRYLDGEPISARPLSRRERLWKAAQRKPFVTAAVIAGSAALLLVGLLFGVMALQSGFQLEEYAQFARESARAKQWDQAKDWWSRVLSMDSGHEEALQGWELAELNRQNSERQMQSEERRRASTIRDNHQQGEALLRAGLYMQALASYQHILALDPEDAVARARKSECEQALAEREKRAAELGAKIEGLETAMLRLEEDDQRRREQRLLAMPEYEAARLTVEKAKGIRLTADGHSVADVRVHYRSAREALSRAVARDPLYAEAYFFRGQIRHKMGEYDRAVADFMESIRLGSKKGPAPFAGAMAHLSAYMIHAYTPLATDTEARAEARRKLLEWADLANKESGQFADRYGGLILAEYFKDGDPERAFDKLQTLGQAAGAGDYAVHFLRACVALESGNPRLADRELTSAIELEPVSIEARFLRAAARARVENLEGALQDARLLLESEPDDRPVMGSLHLLKAHLHQEINEPDLALQNLKAALGLVSGRLAAQVSRLHSQWSRGGGK